MPDVKRKLRWSQLKVSLVITLALFVLLVAIFFAGGIETFFSPTVMLRVQFKDVKGLRKGAPVWINGTEVGSAKGIELDPVHGTIVSIAVAKGTQGFIRKDSQASILTMGLMGDKYIELSTGSPVAEPIRPNDIIKGTAQTEFTDIVETSAVTIQKVSELTARLDHLVTGIEAGQGTVAKFLADPSVYDNLKNATHTLSKTLDDFKSSRGTLKLLIEDPSMYDRALAAITSIEAFSSTLNKGSGTLKKLVEDPSLYDTLLATASEMETFSRKASSDLDALSKKLKDEKGTFQRLVENPELYDNLNRSSQALASILSRVEQGQGMAGALVRDDEMVREMKDAVSKVKALSAEMEGFAVELKALTKDIKENPKKYFQFSIF
jgi:phospholipid/cholesterol/gamma-HCH transport system substrate-binding protein